MVLSIPPRSVPTADTAREKTCSQTERRRHTHTQTYTHSNNPPAHTRGLMTYRCMYMCALACRDKTEQKEGWRHGVERQQTTIAWLSYIAIVRLVTCFMSCMYTCMHACMHSCMCVCAYMCVVRPVKCHVEMYAHVCLFLCRPGPRHECMRVEGLKEQTTDNVVEDHVPCTASHDSVALQCCQVSIF